MARGSRRSRPSSPARPTVRTASSTRAGRRSRSTPPESSSYSNASASRPDWIDSMASVLNPSKAFSGFAVDDADTAKRFYAETLGVEVSDIAAGDYPLLALHVGGGEDV